MSNSSLAALPSLRPLKAGEILDRAFALYRANFWLFVGIAGVLFGPLLILELLCLALDIDDTFISLLEVFLRSYFLEGAMAWASSRVYLGLPVFINDSYRQARRCFKSFFGAYFLLGLAIIPIVILVPVISAFSGFGAGLFIIMVLFLVPYLVFITIRWGLIIPAIVLEDLSGSRGLDRSWFLTSKDFWRIFLVLFASGLLSYLLILLPKHIITYATTQFGFMSVIGPTLSVIFSQLGKLISTPITMSILVILYYDLRVRYEGFDLQFALGITDYESDTSDEQDLSESEERGNHVPQY